MPHYERNIRFVLFLVLPILGFLLGWSLSQKNTEESHTPKAVEVTVQTPSEIEKGLIDHNKPTIQIIRRNDKPKDIDLSIFWETWNVLEANFLHKEEFAIQDQVYGAAKGLTQSLDDPYTVFMTPEETKKFEESISGEFEGIGAEIGIQNGQLTIIAPLKGSPAELAGLKPGDVIFKIDGESTHGISIEEAVTRIRGPKGEKVVLTILRETEKNPLEITIVRDNIVLNSVEWEMRDGVAIVTISQFGTELVKEFQDAVSEILLQQPEGIIIDLRNNGGGLLDACVQTASEFLDQKIIVKTNGRKFGNSGEIMSGRDGAFLETPLVVLVNRGSASASEIFAGAMQDHRRGLVIGEKTFGKGSVQNVVPLSDGSSLKVTIAEWLTPEGHSIHEKGIEPTITVEATEEETDPALEKALEIIGTEEMQTLLQKESEEVSPSEEEEITDSNNDNEEKEIQSEEEASEETEK
ncbi:S41 family peptidase [Candidatus Gracilibacteria bacterium]|nr:S41 family peptidase [Candidatus Gracilibacteria bacterium]MCF7819367.1 S41 family peptidase [Candidatus Gracilibacteria bacterium]